MTQKKPFWLSLGSNLPYGELQPVDVLKAAIAELESAGLEQITVSRFYQTEPVPKSDQPNFVNCAVAGQTTHDAQGLLKLCQSIEQSFERDRTTRWGARTLDIDIIGYDRSIWPSFDEWHAIASAMCAETTMPELVLPHPFMHLRAFVLEPLCDVAPDWQHPVFGSTAQDLLSKQTCAKQLTTDLE